MDLKLHRELAPTMANKGLRTADLPAIFSGEDPHHRRAQYGDVSMRGSDAYIRLPSIYAGRALHRLEVASDLTNVSSQLTREG